MTRRVTARLDDLVGIAEIADLTGSTRQGVCNWIARRTDFPEPVLRLAQGPLFLWSQVEPWVQSSLRKQRRKEVPTP